MSKKPDYLTLCSIAAQKAGLSYGKYMAMHGYHPPIQADKDSRKYCVGCRYFFGYYEGSRCCKYIFVHGEKRPCPPGKDCTERRKKTKNRRRNLIL